ncbi:hypothetical protein BU16DRAFT_329576 [Lophium mytilinum]|uniref:A-kinase anchor protein 7-like phosphoesterase domain-containing protein n=1 Tax=Lophium mytilinum TaxID=390894 RepID=A0A6A6R3F1_9PEZI|nr:hypothetical protein BU16DRAFT_329576 [Lophium mytilinum]
MRFPPLAVSTQISKPSVLRARFLYFQSPPVFVLSSVAGSLPHSRVCVCSFISRFCIPSVALSPFSDHQTISGKNHFSAATMPGRKAKAPNNFCDPKADDVPASTSSSITPIPSKSNPESSNATPNSNPTSSQFTSKAAKPGARPPLTHFLCFPLVTPASRPQLQETLARFKEDVCATENVPEKAIRPLGTLHLTLGVMSLDEESLERAIAMLQSLNIAELLNTTSAETTTPSAAHPTPSDPKETPNTATKASLETAFASSDISATTSACSSGQTGATAPTTLPGPLVISLQGLHSMHPPARTSILYAAPEDPTGRLYPAATKLRDLFTQAGLMVPDDRPLKLHATIINTIYAKASKGGRGAGHGANAKALLRLDAQEMVERYRGFVWAEGVRVERVAICKMGAKKVVDAGGVVVREEYEEVAGLEV